MRFYLALLVVVIILSLIGAVPARAQSEYPDGSLFLPLVGQSAPAGQTVSPSIVGGEDADPHEWPWQVFIIIDNSYICGGSLISDEWVLTAAHCTAVENTYPPLYFYPSQFVVRVGEHDIFNYDGVEQYLGVSEVVGHPNYNPLASTDDIALLRLSTPAVMGNTAAALPLLTSPADDPLATPGTMATATGWGATTMYSPYYPSGILQEVELPIISNATCNQAFGGQITDTVICAGFDTGGRDTCFGDSGGPLVVKDGAGGWKLAGITSFGPRYCATLYGGYTRVSKYTDWISATIKHVEITGFAPSSGPPNTQVTVSGKGFLDATHVQFGDIAAQFTVVSDTQIQANVPANAVSGLIRVVTEYGKADSLESFLLEYPLALAVDGPGTGYVTSTPGSLDCDTGDKCGENYVDGTLLRLDAVEDADPDHVFAGWLGDCTGTALRCSVRVDASKTVTAVFSALTPTLSVDVSAVDGSVGTVTSNPTGVECGDTCQADYGVNSTVTLHAYADDADSKFIGWGGACKGTEPVCDVTMMGAQSVSAIFKPSTYTMTVKLDGNGDGMVTSFPAGIDCGGLCSSTFTTGKTVNLYAHPEPGSGLIGWDGVCSGSGKTCVVTIDSAHTVTAIFEKTDVYFPMLRLQGVAAQ